MEISTHPARLEYPQKRIGARGEGKWQRVSWDEALDALVQKLTEIKKQRGPAAFGVGVGEPKRLEFVFSQRLASAFETRAALMKLDLLIVSELFMTPTAAMADFVLPAATTGEHDMTGYWGEPLQVDTPSGKVEIFSEQIRDLGSSPMPINSLALNSSNAVKNVRQNR